MAKRCDPLRCVLRKLVAQHRYLAFQLTVHVQFKQSLAYEPGGMLFDTLKHKQRGQIPQHFFRLRQGHD
ncbi:hypothetical protein D3C78_1749450 [compost metagenome]